jgi:hypothetical protein
MGGAGFPSAGAGGNSGNIAITANGLVTFRDIDIITGADVENVFSDIFLRDDQLHRYCASTGSLGGRGNFAGATGGNGGAGGNAGSIALLGAFQLEPAVGSTAKLSDIAGFNAGRPNPEDNLMGLCPGNAYVIGQTRQATASDGSTRLYRLRLELTGEFALGGSGGIPSGRPLGQFTGVFGAQGSSANILGLTK